MIVFDVDGTLIGGEPIDWACFRAAFEEVAGFALSDAFFESIEEVTAQAIVHQALSAFPMEEKKEKERAVCQEFLRRLKAAHEENPMSFIPADGALALLQEIKEAGISIAIATGDWRETISFKLRAADIAFEDIPMVTASEFYARADIIAAAVTKAGRSLEEAIYIGDGLWDLRACRKLGIPFFGIGHRWEKLRDAGAEHILRDLNPPAFWQAAEEVKRLGLLP